MRRWVLLALVVLACGKARGPQPILRTDVDAGPLRVGN